MTLIKEVITYLEQISPLPLQESYDNAGLILGDENTAITGVLTCLDCTEAVVDEAVNMGCNLIISHHPVIFGGLKKLNGKNYVERTVIKAIRENIAIYSAHTNLDNVSNGVNRRICDRLGLTNPQILVPKQGLLKKLVTFCPTGVAEAIRLALFETGAGHIGNYDFCSFSVEGVGTFRGGEGTNPSVGKVGEYHKEKEERVEVIFEAWNEARILAALRKAHPYEEVAFDIYPLENGYNRVGSGMIGEYTRAMSEGDFLALLRKSMEVKVIRHSALTGKMIKKVAVCGGSGQFLLPNAMKAQADVLVTADFKYHQFFDADGRILITDIGHYESEQFTIKLLEELILKKFSTFAVHLTKINTNPVHYS